MLAFTIRRLLGAIPLLLGVAVLSFVFMQLAPGGPDALFARNGRMSQAQLDAIRHNMGLDRPMHEQLFVWLGNLLQGDLGTSYTQYQPVTEVIWDVFPNTLILMAAGLALSLVIALAFGILAARRQYGIFDNITSFVSYFGLAMPVFWFGLMLQLLFAVKLGWLPSAGKVSSEEAGSSTCSSTWCCRRSPSPSAASPAGVATSAPPRWKCSARTTCGRPAPRGWPSSAWSAGTF